MRSYLAEIMLIVAIATTFNAFIRAMLLLTCARAGLPSESHWRIHLALATALFIAWATLSI